MSKALFGLMKIDIDDMREQTNKWVLYMFICGIASFFIALFYKYLFGIIAENITINIRSKLYSSFLKKHIGWFDQKENSAGVMVGVLASDVQTLNGASSEGVALFTEVSFAIICGIVLGFYFFWQLSLVALGCIPFMVVGGAMNAKL